MSRVQDYLRSEESGGPQISLKREKVIEDFLHSDLRNMISESCFYYSAGSDTTPILGCLDIVNSFIYCDIQESSNFSDSLYKLKLELRENSCIEQCYCTIEPEWFRLYEKCYKGHYGLKRDFYINNFKAEFSFWKKEHRYFVLIYIDFDNNVIWQNIFLKHQIAPKMICNYCYEGGVDFELAPLSEEMKPQYWLGYGQQIEGYEFFKKVNYLGSYGVPGQTIDLFKFKKR